MILGFTRDAFYWKMKIKIRKSAVESTTLAQPFCVMRNAVNQAVGDLPQHLHAKFVVVRQFPHRYALPSVKTMLVKR